MFFLFFREIGYAFSDVLVFSSSFVMRKDLPNLLKTWEAELNFNLFANVKAQLLRYKDIIGHNVDFFFMNV